MKIVLLWVAQRPYGFRTMLPGEQLAQGQTESSIEILGLITTGCPSISLLSLSHILFSDFST